MSRTNCFLPKSGFCLNLRVRIVKSDILLKSAMDQDHTLCKGYIVPLEP